MTDDIVPNLCPRCGVAVPSDAPGGLCPKCLLVQAAVSTGCDGLPPEAKAPPSRHAVVAAFPQLEVLELIGQGGMGAVFKARQPKLNRFVALKILPERLARDPAFAERFAREGQMLARLNHPSIVGVYDFGFAPDRSLALQSGADRNVDVESPIRSALESQATAEPTGGFYYLLMEFVDGVNLRQALHAGGFTPQQALGIVPKICEALQYAHDEGVLHRDIKPENILLDTKGRVKIADFGIAKFAREATAGERLTGTGAALGTPHYMAPEQIEHPSDVDHRADIYSLGVVFYELLTGELPLGRFAPPSEKSDVDARVDEIVLRSLEKERDRRQQSAREVQTQVETLASAAAAGPAPAERAPVLLASQAMVTDRSRLRSWRGQVFHPFLGVHRLELESSGLRIHHGDRVSVIPLASIRALGQGHYCWAGTNRRLELLALEWDEHERTRSLVLAPIPDEDYAAAPEQNRLAQDWERALEMARRDANLRSVRAIPASELSVKVPSFGISGALLASALLIPTLALIGRSGVISYHNPPLGLDEAVLDMLIQIPLILLAVGCTCFAICNLRARRLLLEGPLWQFANRSVRGASAFPDEPAASTDSAPPPRPLRAWQRRWLAVPEAWRRIARFGVALAAMALLVCCAWPQRDVTTVALTTTETWTFGLGDPWMKEIKVAGPHRQQWGEMKTATPAFSAGILSLLLWHALAALQAAEQAGGQSLNLVDWPGGKRRIRWSSVVPTALAFAGFSVNFTLLFVALMKAVLGGAPTLLPLMVLNGFAAGILPIVGALRAQPPKPPGPPPAGVAPHAPAAVRLWSRPAFWLVSGLVLLPALLLRITLITDPASRAPSPPVPHGTSPVMQVTVSNAFTRGNIAVVDLVWHSTEFHLGLSPRLDGERLDRTLEKESRSAMESSSPIIVLPGQPGELPPQSRIVLTSGGGHQTFRVAFALPDSEMARAAVEQLQRESLNRSTLPGVFLFELFRVNHTQHGLYSAWLDVLPTAQAGAQQSARGPARSDDEETAIRLARQLSESFRTPTQAESPGPQSPDQSAGTLKLRLEKDGKLLVNGEPFEGDATAILLRIREEADLQVVVEAGEAVTADDLQRLRQLVDAAREQRDLRKRELWEQIAQRQDPELRKEALKRVQEMLAGDVVGDHEEAVRALQNVQDVPFDRAPLLPLVRRLLSDPKATAFTRATAAVQLANLGGGTEDIPIIAAMADDPQPFVRKAVAAALYGLDPQGEHALVAPTIEKLLSDTSAGVEGVVHHTIKALWGHPVSPAAERLLIERSKLPGLIGDSIVRYDAVYYALSTRPVVSKPVGERLTELALLPDTAGLSGRAAWGLSHHPASDDARELVVRTLIRIFDDSLDANLRRDCVFGLGLHGGQTARKKLEQIAANEENQTLRDEAQQKLENILRKP